MTRPGANVLKQLSVIKQFDKLTLFSSFNVTQRGTITNLKNTLSDPPALTIVIKCMLLTNKGFFSITFPSNGK